MLRDEGTIRFIGISNWYHLTTLERFYEDARVKPAVLLNRLRLKSFFDIDIRVFCQERGIKLEGYATISDKKPFLESPVMMRLAIKYQRAPAQVLLAFLRTLDITPLCGTRKN